MSFIDFSRVIISYDNAWSDSAKKKIKLALDACAGLETEIEKKYRLWQTVKIVLWEIPEAVEIGFTDYARKAFTERHEALQYHDKNCTDFYNCNICDIMKRWFE
tara:strand:+ start:18560 stop:18871 length:312 start_codon:yes stop_codon:yes gene_type:complete